MKKFILTWIILAGAVFSSLVMLRALAHAENAVYSIDQDNTGFGGGVDFVSIDKVANKYAPIEGILNVNTDRYNEITKKYGSLKYNSAVTDGSLKHRRAYTYNQADGDSYIIVQTGAYLKATTGNGTFTTVISTLTATADCDFTTANDWLYFTNGTDTPGRWNGSALENFTVTNSTQYPTRCKYMTNNWLRNWFAGDSLYPNRVYFSEAFVVGVDTGAYENFPTENYIDLGTNDGDTITGLQVWDGHLLVWFSKKCFEIIALETPGFFGYNQLSNKIGCLYNTSLDILNGMPILVSHRGVEQFNGQNFKTVSMPIDNYVKDLRQLEISQGSVSQTSAEDWGAGTEFINVDTTTVLGSVQPRDVYWGAWEAKASAVGWQDIAMSADGTKQVAVADATVYRSTDTGATWQAKAVLGNAYRVDMSKDGRVQAAAAPGGYIYVSTDTGSTWQQRAVSANWYGIAVSSDGVIQAAVDRSGSVGSNVYISTNTGLTWSNKAVPGTSYNGVDISADGSIISVCASDIYISTDTGNTWNTKSITGWATKIKMSDNGTTQVAICEFYSGFADTLIYRSIDTGNTWTLVAEGPDWYGIDISSSGTRMIASAANIVYLSIDSGATWSDKYSGSTLSAGACAMSDNGWITSIAVYNVNIYVNTTVDLYSSASFTSKISTTTGFGQWQTVSIDDNQPTGSAISYYVKTSTANDNFHIKAGVPVSNGSVINSANGNYIQLISSFTRPDPSVTPVFNEFTARFISSDNNYPQGKVFDDRYYLAVNTGPATMNNDTILIMQKNGDWTRYDNKVGCFTVYREKLYYGDSQDTGFMYRMEVPNLYTDNGNNYQSYWTSKRIGLHPFYKTNYKELWLTTKGIDSTLDISYNFDTSDDTWTSDSITLTDDYDIFVSRFNILPDTFSRYFQFKIGNTGANDFRIKRLDLIYDSVPSAE